MKLLSKLLASTVAIFVSAYLLPGVVVESFLVAAIVAIVLGALNAFLKPILVFLTLPITMLTLGLFVFVINVVMVLLAEYLVPGFSIASIWTAVVFSLLMALIAAFLNTLLK